MRNNRHFIIALAALASTGALANTVPFSENFNGDWRTNFPIRVDADRNAPTSQMLALFLDGDTGSASPWWHLKDSNTSDDRFLGSHARYSTPGTSNDWIGSRAIEIPTEGFNLTFGAQSARYGNEPSVSTLWLYITESPLDADNLPTEPTAVYEDVPENDPAIVEKDFTVYTVNLDKWAGKTIYINFANKNTEKDFLCIDDVKVERLDKAELEASTESMIVKGEFVVSSKMTAVENLGKWTLTFSDGVNADQQVGGESLEAGTVLDHVWKGNAEGNSVIDYTVTLDVEDMQPVVSKGSIQVLDFKPYRRVLVEEATGLWCGNCPMGIYNMDEIMKDDEMKEYAIPVSVHIPGSGVDHLVDLNYAGLFGVNAAPAYRLDRDLVVRYFSIKEDTKFDKTNPNSMANAVVRRHNELTTLDLDLEAEYHVVDGDTIQILATARLKAAKDFNNHNMRLGFIVKENNVHADSPLMLQHNYFSNSKQIDGLMGGWVNLPEVVGNVRFNDVARGVYSFRGIEGSIPELLECGKEYELAFRVAIPEVFYQESYGGQMQIGSPELKTDFVTLVAFVVDLDTSRIVNAASFPMTEHASFRYDSAAAGVDEIGEAESFDPEAPVVWYDLQGRRVADPENGMFIRVQGGKTEKVMLK